MNKLVTFWQWLFTVSILKEVACFTEDLLQVSNIKSEGEIAAASGTHLSEVEKYK